MLDLSPDKPEAAYGRLRASTLPGLLAQRAMASGGAPAHRAKKLGIYKERSWAWLAGEVAALARGLRELGLKPGGRVAIMGDPCEEWVIADYAVQAAGGISFGIYPTASPGEVAYQLAHSGARLFIAENQEYVDKVLPLLADLPDVSHVIVADTTAMFIYDDARILALDDVIAGGRASGDTSPDALAAMAAALSPDDTAFIVYTSGTTGHPKGAVVGHGRHLAAAFNLVAHYPQMARKGQRTVVNLPQCHVLGRDAAITVPLLTDMVPHYGDSIEDFPNTCFEVAPTVLFTVPRYLQKFASQILVGIENTSALKRAVYDLALARGRAALARLWEGRAPGPACRLLRFAAFRPMLSQLGLDRLELVLCGGSALPRETMALWHIFGVNVCEMYGQTETAGGIIAGQRGPFPQPGSVGTAPAGWAFDFGDKHEIRVTKGDLFDGYWRDDKESAAAFDEAGRLLTGDVGRLSGGQLAIIDRARDFIVTAGGKTLSPTTIENALKASSYISEVIAFGDNRKYVSALIELDQDTVAEWARSNNVAQGGFTALTRDPAVIALIEGEIARANSQLARVEQVKKFMILPKILDPEEEGEPVTPTRKVKRSLMYERFRDLVEGMYDKSEEERIAGKLGEVF